MFTKKRKGDSVTYGIIGLGRFGQALALELAAANEEILVMDREEEKCACCGTIPKMPM